MKKLMVVALAAFAMYSCGNTQPKQEEVESSVTEDTFELSNIPIEDMHSARISLDYEGTYKGTLPTASGSGQEVTITLAEEDFVKKVVYVGKKESFENKGTYTWNEAGSTITLLGVDAPNQYFVGENQLFALDIEGKRIEGELADQYILKK